jgi:Tfp pilus assembly protein PilV
MAAICILTIGLVAMATLMATTMTNSERSRYMSNAAVLASEKLEDLNHFPASDPGVKVTGATAGGLTSDASQAGVNYYDDVELSATGGGVTETLSGDDGSGGTTYTTTVHQPDGTITSTTSSSAPTPPLNSLRYHRRWVIEKDSPVVGVRRITVLVQLTNPPVTHAVTFQMSMVRP